MKRYKKKIQETITVKDIDQLKKEFGMFMKNFSRIQNARDLYEVHKASMLWAENLDEFVYKRLIGAGTKRHNEPQNEQLRKKIWAIVIDMKYAFDIELREIPYELRTKTDQHNIIDTYGGELKTLWEYIYPIWVSKKKNKYQKLARIGREAFPLLYEYLSSFENSMVSDAAATITKIIDGVKFVIRYTEGDDKYIQMAHNMIKPIQKAFGIIKKAGLGLSLQGLIINFHFAYNAVSDAGGFYDPSKKREISFQKATSVATIIETTIHEVGHRYFYEYLTKSNKDIWEDFVENNRHNFTEFEVKQIIGYFNKAYKQFSKITRDKLNVETISSILINSVEDSFLKMLLSVASSRNSNRTAYLYYKNSTPINIFMDAFYKMRNDVQRWADQDYDFQYSSPMSKEDFEVMLDFIESTLTTLSITTAAVSGYANKNLDEAYADAFLHYCMDYPMTPFIRVMFKKVSGLD